MTSVDSSGPALELARRNAELNGVDIGEVVEADAFTYLRGLRDRARQYDMIILDPPKLAATAGQLDKATRAYKDLNLLALKLLAPGGLLLTFSCSAAMTLELFQKVVAGAALDAQRDVRDRRPPRTNRRTTRCRCRSPRPSTSRAWSSRRPEPSATMNDDEKYEEH